MSHSETSEIVSPEIEWIFLVDFMSDYYSWCNGGILVVSVVATEERLPVNTTGDGDYAEY